MTCLQVVPFCSLIPKLFLFLQKSLFRGPKWLPKCLNGVLGEVFVLKSGLRILIWAPQVPFSVPLKNPKWVILGVFGYFPLKPKNFTANGRKCPTAKTKTVLE